MVAGFMEAAAFDIQASILRRAQTDQNAFAEGLAVRLAEAFPNHVTIERTGWGILHEKRVSRLIVEFEAHRYTLALHGNEWRAERVPLVRGVGLRTERLTLSSWLAHLIRVVEASASQQSEATNALHDFLMS